MNIEVWRVVDISLIQNMRRHVFFHSVSHGFTVLLLTSDGVLSCWQQNIGIGQLFETLDGQNLN